MKTINESEYRPEMGILIDVKDSISYNEKIICIDGFTHYSTSK